MDWLALSSSPIRPNVASDSWAAITLSGFLGSLVGGAVTAAVVVMTIRHERRSAIIERLDTTVIEAHRALEAIRILSWPRSEGKVTESMAVDSCAWLAAVFWRSFGATNDPLVLHLAQRLSGEGRILYQEAALTYVRDPSPENREKLRNSVVRVIKPLEEWMRRSTSEADNVAIFRGEPRRRLWRGPTLR